jgi:outer membrane protein OmpA-like peptidoglycan-associated protein
VLGISRQRAPGLDTAAQAASGELIEWQADLADGAPVAQQLMAWLQARAAAPWQTVNLLNNAGMIYNVLKSARAETIPAGTNLRLIATGVEFVEGSPGINFDDDNALTAEGQDALDELAAFMAADSSMRVRIRAHTDDKEDGELEAEITEARAQAVIDYLISQGVSENRLRSEGVGAMEPLFPNVSERNRQLNNRIELQVVR